MFFRWVLSSYLIKDGKGEIAEIVPRHLITRFLLSDDSGQASMVSTYNLGGSLLQKVNGKGPILCLYTSWCCTAQVTVGCAVSGVGGDCFSDFLSGYVSRRWLPLYNYLSF